MSDSWHSSLILSSCEFRENSTGVFGGGLASAESNSTLANCVFSENSAGGGGGMYSSDGNSVLSNCIFTANSAGTSGGMYNRRSDSKLSNCVFAGNCSYPWGGGGMDNYDHSNSILTNCTFAGNYAHNLGGAMYNGWYSNSTLINCIVWENVAADGNQIDNEDFSTATFSYSDVQGGWPGEGNINLDPLFVDSGEDNYRLLAGSPCIDSGDPNFTAGAETTDLDGNCRIFNGVVDMGAYEAQLPDPLQLLAALAGDVVDSGLGKGIEKSLLAKINAAIRKQSDDSENNNKAVINVLRAFINAVEAQAGKKIAEDDAEIFIAGARRIIEILSQSN